MFSTVDLFNGHQNALPDRGDRAGRRCSSLVLLAPVILRGGRLALGRAARACSPDRGGAGPGARRPRRVPPPALGGDRRRSRSSRAWALQWLSCYVLLVALGLDDHAGVGAAAAVLFAVNVTAVLPATPSNLGVFQAACVAVLPPAGTSATATRWPTAIDPAGRRGRDRDPDGHARAGQGGHVLARRAAARDARGAGQAARPGPAHARRVARPTPRAEPGRPRWAHITIEGPRVDRTVVDLAGRILKAASSGAASAWTGHSRSPESIPRT